MPIEIAQRDIKTQPNYSHLQISTYPAKPLPSKYRIGNLAKIIKTQAANPSIAEGLRLIHMCQRIANSRRSTTFQC